MERIFRTDEYVRLLGDDLVFEFSKAGLGTHTHAVGGARENSAKNKLSKILGERIGIGSGFVIDSFGGVSKQCDIIIYEKDFAQTFTINEDEANTYFNCESVIAVGEVKSDATINDIKDAITKLKIVRELKRHTLDRNCYRRYLSATSLLDALEHNAPLSPNCYDQTNKLTDQIYTFVVCKSLKTTLDSILKEMNNICENHPTSYLNSIVSTTQDYITYGIKKDGIKRNIGAIGANSFLHINHEKAFNLFCYDLTHFIDQARTVPLNYSIYFYPGLEENINCNFLPLNGVEL